MMTIVNAVLYTGKLLREILEVLITRIKVTEGMDVFTNLIVIISQYIHVSNHHIVLQT